MNEFTNFSKKSKRHTPAIQFCSAQNHDPVMPSGVVFNELLQYVAAHRTSTQDSQKFERYYCFVCETPSKVGAGVLLPYYLIQKISLA